MASLFLVDLALRKAWPAVSFEMKVAVWPLAASSLTPGFIRPKSEVALPQTDRIWLCRVLATQRL